MMGGQLRRRNSGALVTRRMLWRALFFLLPSYVLLRLHWALDDLDLSGFLADQTDFFSNDLLALHADYPRLAHGAFADFSRRSRHLSPEQQTELYANQNTNAATTAAANEEDPSPQLHTNIQKDTATKIKKRSSFASVPLSKRKQRVQKPPTSNPTANTNDDKETSGGDEGTSDGDEETSDGDKEMSDGKEDDDETQAALLFKKKRQQQQRRRRQQENTEAWVQHPENITDFSYVPIGKFATRY